MKHCKVIIAVLWCTLYAVYGYNASESDNYKVVSFGSAANNPKVTENDVIKGEIDSVLTEIPSLKEIYCRPGKLLLRSKTATGTHRLFRGVLDTAAFGGSYPLYIFSIPRWARLEDMLQYRLYRAPTESIGDDESTLYFDNERIYSRTTSRLYYYRSGVWFPIEGNRKLPYGSLAITSEPSGAEVLLNGVSIAKRSNCTVDSLIGGIYSIELKLPHYQFFSKSVKVIPDSTVAVSFELISDVDTVFITGDAEYSLLLLPHPPKPAPFIIDDSITLYSTRIRLPPGEHTVTWSGDERYVPLDTTITIAANRVLFFDYLFKKRYGIIRIVPTPFDADVCIEKVGCHAGERVEELVVGLYRVDVFRQGFAGIHTQIHVRADTVTTHYVDLFQVPDSDGDGYIDSVDECPANYGLYSGCSTPQLGPIVKSLLSELTTFVRNDRFTMGISLLGIVSKTPINRSFRSFISLFSDGRAGGVNNYKGITALNSIECTWRGFYLNGELGQWSSGLRYRRDDSLFLDDHHYFYFDSLMNVEPILYIPSTALSFGVHYNRSWLDIAYAVGYQWEDIVIHQLYNDIESTFERLVFNNDWWYHQLSIGINFNNGDRYFPAIYFRMKYPFGVLHQTRWTSFNAGFQLKITTPQKE